tara:strand:- start:8879 stop:17368 length:8490 start_codon:yes stop_codon:yes gene_type:complete
MAKFVLTAQMQLQAPTNLTQVRNQIQQQLSNVTINPQINTQSLANANAQIANVGKAANNASKSLGNASRSAQSLGSALGAAARRFASITLATGFFLGLVRGISDAVGRAVEFEREMLKISQVTGKTSGELRGLTKEVTRLSIGLGVNSAELLNTARTLNQAGFSAQKTKAALEILARTDLAATFENLQATTEGAIALLRQFRTEARAAGGDIKFLEQSLDAINAVSKNFAVEAGDLIAVIRRTGGVFEAAGGKLNELIALFTSVRGTTRETAETIATGFRTIFTRIQRTETVDQLRELGIELRNAKGEFVGPLEAIKRLQIGLAGLSATDFRFQEIIEQLGGFRQVGKVIPLLKQYETTAEALAIANNAMGSTAADAATAQQGLGNAFQKLKEKFDSTVRNIADSDTFQTLARGAIKLAESILNVVEALEPLLPLLTSLAAFKLGQIAIPAFGKFAGIGGRNQGGKIYGFNNGGFVPGTGNRDTVPAMLTPGEFVIRKSSVKKIGAANLAAVNGYNDGGEVDVFTITGMEGRLPAIGYTQATSGNRGKTMLSGPVRDTVKNKYSHMLSNTSEGKRATMPSVLRPEDKIVLNTPFINAPANKSLAQAGDTQFIERHLKTAVHGMATEVGNALDMDVPPLLAFNESAAASSAMKGIDLKTISGYMFESIASTLSGSPVGGSGEFFDMQQARAYTEKLEKLFAGEGRLAGMLQMELKRTLNTENLRGADGSLTTKLLNSMTGANPFGLKMTRTAGTPDDPMSSSSLLAGMKSANVTPGGRTKFFGGRIGAYNKGGSVDTVPAMLTPGEYVINKKAAQSIGYGNLNRMNKSGVAHFNSGGAVQHFQFGGAPTSPNPLGAAMSGGGGANPMAQVDAAAKTLANALTSLATAVTGSVDDMNLLGMIDDNLAKASTPLFNALHNAAAGIGPMDEKINGMLTPAATTLSSEMARAGQALYAGLSVVDDQLKQQMQVAVEAIVAASTNFAGGISTLDDTLRTQLQSALNPLKPVMTALQAEMKKVGTELMKKIAVFDQLKDDVATLQGEMQKLGQGFIEKLDDFNPIKVQVPAVATSLQFLSESIILFVQTVAGLQTNLAGAVGTAVNSFAAMGSGGANPFAALSGPLAKTNKFVLKINQVMMGVGEQLYQLASNLANLNKSVSKGSISITNVGGAASNTGPVIDGLEQQIIKLKAELAEVQNQMNTMGNQAVTTKGPVGKGGGGGGGAMAGLGNAAMMATFMAPMLLEFTNLSDATKEAASNALMLAGVLGMLIVPMGRWLDSVVAGTAANVKETISSNVSAASDMAEAGASGVSTGADLAEAGGSAIATAADTVEAGSSIMAGLAAMGMAIAAAPFTILAVALTALIGVVAYFQSSLKKTAETAVKASNEMLDAAREGEGNVDRAELDKQGRIAVNATAKGESVGFGNLASITSGFKGYSGAFKRLSEGTSKATDALVLIPVIGPYIVGLSDAMDEQAQAMRSGQKAMKLLNDARVIEAESTGARIRAMKKIEEADLQGAERRKAVTKANADFTKSTNDLAAANAAQLAYLDSDVVAKGIMSAEELQEAQDDLSSKIKDRAKQQQEITAEERAALDEMISEMREGGQSFAEIFGSEEYKKQLQKIGDSAAAAAKMEAQASGASRKAGLEAINMTEEEFDQLRGAERELAVARMHAAQQAYEANAAEEARQNAMEGTDKKQRELAEAEMKRIAELEALRAAEVEVMRAEIKRREVLNRLQSAQISYMNTVDGMIGSIQGLSGAIQDTTNNSIKLAETLQDGFTPAAFAAASDISPVIANNIKEGLEKNKELREGFMSITQASGGQKLSMKQREEALAGIGIDLDTSGISKDMRDKVMIMLEDGIQPDEIEELVGIFGAEVGTQIDLLKQVNEAQQKHISLIREAGKLELEARKKIRSAVLFEVDVRQKGADRIREATGKEITIAEARMNMFEKVNAMTMGQGGLGVQQLGNRASTLLDERNKIQGRRDARGKEDAIDQKMANDQKFLNQQINNTKEALKQLADQSELASAVMSEIQKEQSKRAAVQESIKSFTFATNEERMNMTQEFAALTRVLQTGNLNSIPDQMRGAVGKLLDQFKDIEFMPGMTGGDISKRLQVQQMDQQFRMMSGGRQGVPPQLVKAIFESTTQEEKLINDLRAINEEEQAAAAQLRKLEQQEAQTMIEAATKQIQVSEALLKWLQARIENESNDIAEGNANGGLVYRAGGGTIFKPRGTDTVPAMLTPGEFVIRKSAVDKIGVGALTALNNGNANTVYKADGGLVADGNSVAMGIARNMGVAHIAKNFNADPAQIRRVWKASDLGGLIGLTGGERSPFRYIQAYLNTLRQYEFLFKKLDPTGIQLKNDPASINGAQQLVKALRGVTQKHGFPANFLNDPASQSFRLGQLMLHEAIRNPQAAAEGVIGPQGQAAMPADRRDLTPAQVAANKKASVQERKNRRKNSTTVPYPIFKNGVLVGHDNNKPRISYAKFLQLKEKNKKSSAAIAAGQEALGNLAAFQAEQEEIQADKILQRKGLFAITSQYQNRTFGFEANWSPESLARWDLMKSRRIRLQGAGTQALGFVPEDKQRKDFNAQGTFKDIVRELVLPPNAGNDYLTKTEEAILAKVRPTELENINKRTRAEASKRMLMFEKIMGLYNLSFFGQPVPGYTGAVDNNGFLIPAQAQGFARGGSVDSVPAMLTPGEFVMSRSAVKKHGTGFMNAVNRGKVPGFAKGGSVGGVQYKQNGGILSSMGSGLMEGISNALSSFDGIANMLSNVASMFSDMSISHTVQVDGTLNIPGFSQQEINQIIQVIGNSVVSQTATKIDTALEQFKNELNQRSD